MVSELDPDRKCASEDAGPQGGGLLDPCLGKARMVSNPTSLGEEKVKCLICVGTSLPSTRPFGSSLASNSMGTPKLSELGLEQSQDG